MGKRPSGVDVKWLDTLEDHDYPAAESRLSLLQPADAASAIVRQLRVASVLTLRRRYAENVEFN